MIEKIISLGAEVPDTGEPRVQLVDDSLVKTASNEIQKYWAELKPDDKHVFVHVIAMTAGEYYGCNRNGDFFREKDLKEHHKSFLSSAHIFLHHVNKDPKKSIGKPVYSFYNDNMHRVELILAIQRDNPLAKDTVDKIKSGAQVYVSMGCRVPYDECSICGNKAKTRAQYCEHLRYNMRRILPDGRQVYALNPPPLKFFDISFVRRPADPTAYGLAKVAAQKGTEEHTGPTSSELGDAAAQYRSKLADIRKVGDIVKNVEGTITKGKDGDKEFKGPALPDPANLPYDAISASDAVRLRLSPGGILRAPGMCGGFPSLYEAAVASGVHHMGPKFRDAHVGSILGALPGALRVLELDPMRADTLAQEILDDYRGELRSPVTRIMVVRKMRPIVEQRVFLAKTAAAEPVLDASGLYEEPVTPVRSTNHLLGELADTLNSPQGGHYDSFRVRGSDGRTYTSTRRAMRGSDLADSSADAGSNVARAALALAALATVLSGASPSTKLVGAPLLGLAAAKIGPNKAPRVQTEEGYEAPALAGYSRVEKSLTKTSGDTLGRLATATAMGVPAVLGLDYWLAKHYTGKPPKTDPDGSALNRAGTELGRSTVENPALPLAAGLAARPATSWTGSLAKKILRRK